MIPTKAPATRLPTAPPQGLGVARVLARVAALNARVGMEYRTDFLMALVWGVLWQVTSIAFVWALMERFHAMAGWTMPEILFMYSLRLVSHGAYMVEFASVRDVPYLLESGEMDRLLLRPVNPLWQVLVSRFHGNAIGDLGVGVAMLLIAQALCHVVWTPFLVGLAALLVLSSAVLEAALQLAAATLSFWVQSFGFIGQFIGSAINTFGPYPTLIYGRVVSTVFLWIPIAFITYLPAALILGRPDHTGFAPVLAYGTPAIALASAALAYLFWNRGLRRYQSTGT